MERAQLIDAYRRTRALSLELARPLPGEAWRIQSMPDVSPPWWNLGHTTWFFAKNVLEPMGAYRDEDARLEFVLNSYYEALGPRLRRDRRGLVTRPTNEEVVAFRASVDQRVEEVLGKTAESDDRWRDLEFAVALGIQHEQQHQELLVTEVKHILGTNPAELRSAYGAARPAAPRPGPPLAFVPCAAGLGEFGNLEGGWCWDNELAVHRAWLDDFALASRLVSNREYLEFLAAGGYRDPLLWLSNGWARVQEEGWQAPLYWERRDGAWRVWTLAGERPLDLDEPVCHVSFYEANAYARWRAAVAGDPGLRLPTEREWERAARAAGFRGDNFLEDRHLHPRAPAANGAGLLQMAGDLWEWTTSHYEPYPGYRPFPGAVQEYNGKFMDNQRVLRGGSCATPRDHIRPSYRNFWPPETRFQFTGIRLARDGSTHL